MYTTTFYSFKGGVGRTMALMNVAVDLVAQGRRVLVVDFDLEAPGIGTFSLFKDCEPRDGLLEFIEAYIESGEVPNVEHYVHKLDSPTGSDGALFFLSAGRQNESYGHRLGRLDWEELYKAHDGYLLLEELKAQCEKVFSLDYMLIDSRTGHTDISGICTRQLPDAVVALFFPNEQNLSGLRKIIQNVRAESAHKIALHFVPSNVPDLDDEESILADLMTRFRNDLGFDQPSAVIHHSNSLSLLNQALYVLDRPKSSLAKEYRALTVAIRQANEEDSEGAISFIEKILEAAQHGQRPKNISALENRLQNVFERHVQDARVLDALYRLRVQQGDFVNGFHVLNALIDRIGVNNAEYRFRRSMIFLNNGERTEAIKDLRAGLQNKSASYFDLNYAAAVISRADPTIFQDFFESPALSALPEDSKLRLLSTLSEIGGAQPFVVEGLREEIQKLATGDRKRPSLVHQLAIACIAQGRFQDAKAAFEKEYAVPNGMNLAALFNYAIAVWGLTNAAPLAMLKDVLRLGAPKSNGDLSGNEANRLQCLSLAAHLVGDDSLAKKYLWGSYASLERHSGLVLSGWRFYRVTPSEFKQDLDELKMMLEGKNAAPTFMRKKMSSVN